MPTSTLSNPGAAFGLSATTASQEVIHCIANQASGTLAPGDVVIFDVASISATSVGNVAAKVKTTTTAKDPLVAGVVAGDSTLGVGAVPTYAIGASVPVVIGGLARVNIAANTVAAGAVLGTTTAAKVGGTAATPASGDCFGIALAADTTKDANNAILAWITKF